MARQIASTPPDNSLGAWRNGRPSFVLMSPDELESIEETLDILSDAELAESLFESLQESAEGNLLLLRDHT